MSNDRNDDYPTMTIHQLVERQVSHDPDVIAIIFQNQQLTYGELNQKANQLARYLKTLGVGPEVLVGICVERSLMLVIALLAILKAGGAYVPLDPAYPQERLTYMLEDAKARVLLTQSHLAAKLSTEKTETQVIDLEQDWETIAQNSQDDLLSETQPEHLAYVLYTSGSTGKPKGVAMPQLPLVNLLQWQLKQFKIPRARTLQFTPISFDVSFQEIFSTLAAGGTLVLISEATRRNAETLLHYLSEYQIERLFLPFVALQHLAEVAKTQTSVPLYLQEVITAGEQLKITPSIAQLFRRLENCTLCNQYGPSESHVVTAYTLSGLPETWTQLPPIGLPINNTQIYLLDPKLRRKCDPIKLAEAGEAGELAIGGIALARGYLNQPEMTDSKFVSNPLSDEPNARLYRTGDLVRYGPDGNLEFIERIDNQVKIRGVRIEIGEIEVALSSHSAIKDIVVVVRDNNSGDKQLVAYFTPLNVVNETGANQLSVELSTLAKEKLPSCMVPSAFVYMAALPLTPSGKVDRRALPALDQAVRHLSEAFISPRTPLEQTLSEIWKQVLTVPQVGVHDNFFELGGDSLRAIHLVFRVRDTFQINLPIVALFDAPTIAEFSLSVEAAICSKATTTSDDISVSELEAEAAIDLDIDPAKLPTQLGAEPEKILITGVTGFLGAFLLHELLEQTQAKIYCLVRADDLAEARQDIQNNLEKYLLWNEVYNSRIFPVLGDLAQPRVGFSNHQFLQLANEIDVIYHNGAFINLIYPYAALRAANVLGTQELLKLATTGRVKPFHFISTLDVFQTGRSFSSNLITEQDPLNPHDAIHFDGYTKSKWVSEKMVTIAREQGLPVCIYRPAMITGHSKTGAANVNDLMNRLIKGFVQLKSAPQSEMMINIAPADYFSKGAVYLSRQASSLGKTFNFVNPNPVSMSQFIEILNACGYPIKLVNHSQWEELLIQNIGNLDGIVSVLTSKTSEKSLSYLEKSSVGAYLASCQNVLDGLKNTSIVCPSINTRLLGSYFSYYTRSGFLDVAKPQITAVFT